VSFDPVDPRIESYMRSLAARHDEPVLLEMEALAKEKKFPIVDRLVGELLELLTGAIGAKTVFEMGSGFGYSAYWFSRAVGPDGTVICTDGDAGNRDLAEGFLQRVGRRDRIDYHVGWAQEVLNQTPGEFDIVYCDIDKGDYPEAWELARDRVRQGGLYICDNVLWSGRVAEPDSADNHPEWTKAIHRQNEMVYADPAFDVSIVPTRDGVLIARKK
jgi:caffeoyl-CoA O-methyltransferase